MLLVSTMMGKTRLDSHVFSVPYSFSTRPRVLFTYKHVSRSATYLNDESVIIFVIVTIVVDASTPTE